MLRGRITWSTVSVVWDEYGIGTEIIYHDIPLLDLPVRYNERGLQKEQIINEARTASDCYEQSASAAVYGGGRCDYRASALLNGIGEHSKWRNLLTANRSLVSLRKPLA
jgi:hypothetical protein